MALSADRETAASRQFTPRRAAESFAAAGLMEHQLEAVREVAILLARLEVAFTELAQPFDRAAVFTRGKDQQLFEPHFSRRPASVRLKPAAERSIASEQRVRDGMLRERSQLAGRPRCATAQRRSSRRIPPAYAESISAVDRGWPWRKRVLFVRARSSRRASLRGAWRRCSKTLSGCHWWLAHQCRTQAPFYRPCWPDFESRNIKVILAFFVDRCDESEAASRRRGLRNREHASRRCQ